MYFILNYLPVLIQALIVTIPLNLGFISYPMISLFVFPIYLLYINISKLNKQKSSVLVCLINMILVAALNTGVFPIWHKILYGSFMGDIPEDLLYIQFFVPTAIIIIGILIFCYVKSVQSGTNEISYRYDASGNSCIWIRQGKNHSNTAI